MTGPKPRMSWWLGSSAGALLLLSILGGAAYLRFGSIRDILAYLDGKTITISPQTFDVGPYGDGDVKLARFAVANRGRLPILIIGGQTSCSCVSLCELPIRIEAGSSADLSFSLKLKAGRPSLPQSILLYTDMPDQPTIALRVDGSVSPAKPQPEVAGRHDDGG